MLVAAPAAAQAAPYVALGDSYSSGVGTREYYANSGSCYRSPHAYPVKAAAARGHTLNFAACSGARTGDVINNQLGGLNSATRYVTISIGGNDAGFSSVITQCAKPWPYSCNSNITNAQSYINNTLPGQLNSVFSQIRTRAPSAKMVMVGYPRLFMGIDCNGGTFFSGDEMTKLNQTADLMANVESARASANGATFVDSRSAFTGHAVCSSSEWINGLSNPIMESYHPNRSGQTGYTNLVSPQLTGNG